MAFLLPQAYCAVDPGAVLEDTFEPCRLGNSEPSSKNELTLVISIISLKMSKFPRKN